MNGQASANGHTRRTKDAIGLSSEKPAPMPVNPDGIPDELKALSRWVCWRWEQRTDKTSGKTKWTKPPVNPRTGRHADVTSGKRVVWLPFEEALAYYQAG